MNKQPRWAIHLISLLILAMSAGCQTLVKSKDPVEGWAVLAEKDDYKSVNMTDMLTNYIDISRMRRRLRLQAGIPIRSTMHVSSIEKPSRPNWTGWRRMPTGMTSSFSM